MKYFYISEITPIKKEEHLGILSIDGDCNYDLINPIYQLYIMLTRNGIRILDMLFDVENNGWYTDFFNEIKSVDEVEDIYFSIFRSDDFFVFFEESIDINTSIYEFVNGSMWHQLRSKCRQFLKEAGMAIWPSFEKPIEFSIFTYPNNFKSYEPLPYWANTAMTLKEWELKKIKCLKLYKEYL